MSNSWTQVVYTLDRLTALQSQREKLSFLYGPNSEPYKTFMLQLEKAKQAHSQAMQMAV